MPKVAGAAYTFGWFAAFDPKPNTGTMIFWGNNQIELMGGFIREEMRSALLGGAKLIVIDPKKTDIAKRSDLWICPRPGTDGILAMGMIKFIIENKLYDEKFVANWTVGFDELAKEVNNFTFEDVEKITWVAKEKIEKAVNTFIKHKPVCLAVGNGVERSIHAFQQLRAIFILRAILGDMNTPGGNVYLTPGNFKRPGLMYALKGSPRLEKVKQKRVVGSEFRVATQNAYIPTQALVKTIITEKPFAIKAALCILTNPLLSYPDTRMTTEAFKKLDFLVVSELFPTPTTEIADLVLPAAWGAEHDSLGYWPGWHEELRAYPKFVEPPGEAKADAWWIKELAKRIGLGNSFWKDEEDSFDEMLSPSGLTWKKFINVRSLNNKKEYKKPEEGLFKTKSGKVEIYSAALEKAGRRPLPTFEEMAVFRFVADENYPLLLFNAKEAAYMLTGYKHVKFLRERRPEPTVDLNPNTAKQLGLTEGDWVLIETHKGRIKQKLCLDPNLDERLVFASFGWWFPERKDNLFAYEESNINVLTDAEPPYDGETGAAELGGIPCRVYKA